MRARRSGLLSAVAAGACAVALAMGPAPQASASAGLAAGSPAAARGHDYPGAPKDTPRCRKLLRKIERARDDENYDLLNRLARRYNRTCRVK